MLITVPSYFVAQLLVAKYRMECAERKGNVAEYKLRQRAASVLVATEQIFTQEFVRLGGGQCSGVVARLQ